MPRHGPPGNPHNLPRRPRRAMPGAARPVVRRRPRLGAAARPGVGRVRRPSRRYI